MKFFVFLFMIHMTHGQLRLFNYEKDKKVPVQGKFQEAILQFPWMAALHISKQQAFATSFCSGSLIGSEYVLTSAYCIDGAVSIDVVLGSDSITDECKSHIRVKSEIFYVHPEWDPHTLNHNIGLVRLPLPIAFSKYITPAKLWHSPGNWNNWNVNVTGWQQSTKLSYPEGTLKYTPVRIIPNDACLKHYSYFDSEEHFCVTDVAPKSMCYGNDGGPLNYYAGKRLTYIAAIASFGFNDSCQENRGTYPVVYTQAHKYINWITNFTPYI